MRLLPIEIQASKADAILIKMGLILSALVLCLISIRLFLYAGETGGIFSVALAVFFLAASIGIILNRLKGRLVAKYFFAALTVVMPIFAFGPFARLELMHGDQSYAIFVVWMVGMEAVALFCWHCLNRASRGP